MFVPRSSTNVLRSRTRRPSTLILALCASCVTLGTHTRELCAQAGDTTVAQRLAPGVDYRQFVDKTGPWRVGLVRVDLRKARVDLHAARAADALRGREKPSDMSRRMTDSGFDVLAAVNADFFELRSGENENNQVIDGEWWKGLKVTDSPYDTYDNVHVQFGVDGARHLVMDRFILDAKAWVRGTMTPIVTVNAIPSGNIEGSALFTSRYGSSTPRDSARKSVEAPLAEAGHHGDTLLYVRHGAVVDGNGSPIPAHGAVLSAFGARAAAVRAMNDGDTVRVLLATLPRLPKGTPQTLVGGWPRILRDGVNVAGDAATVEGTISRNAEARHPRTAIGFSRDSTRLYLVTVDGRAENSGGVTLTELAALMRKLGAWQAMNFDGGGSTTMVIGGRVVNTPSDSTGERAVGNTLMIVRRK